MKWFEMLKVATAVTSGSTYGGEANPATDALFNITYGKDEEDEEERSCPETKLDSLACRTSTLIVKFSNCVSAELFL